MRSYGSKYLHQFAISVVKSGRGKMAAIIFLIEAGWSAEDARQAWYAWNV